MEEAPRGEAQEGTSRKRRVPGVKARTSGRSDLRRIPAPSLRSCGCRTGDFTSLSPGILCVRCSQSYAVGVQWEREMTHLCQGMARGRHSSLFPKATKAKPHARGLTHRNVFLHSSGAQESQIKVLAGPAPSEAMRKSPSFWCVVFLALWKHPSVRLQVHMAFSLCGNLRPNCPFL